MADNTIDTLDIQIDSSTRNATKALGNLVKKLKDVDIALGNVNTGGLRNYAREIGRVSAALQALNKTKVSVPNLAGLTGQLRSLSKVDFTTLGASTKSLQNLAAGLSSLKGASNISIPKIDTKNVKSAVNAIQKFQEIDAVKMQPAITGVEKIASTMNALNGMNFKDSKITNVINSLSRLAAADISGFDTSKMGEIIKSIDSLNDIEDISSSVNRFVGSLARLANAGEKTSQSASGLKTLGKELRKVVNSMASTRAVSESTNMFVQSIGRLANAGNKTGQTASQLANLATEVKKFFTAMQDAPQISENTLRMTEALGQLAAAGGKVGTATNTVVNSFNKLSSIGSGLSSLLGGIATKAKSGLGFLAAGISSLVNRSSGLKTASSNVGSFIKTVLGFKAASAVMNKFSEAMGGKGILEIGSDIAEVENVVDVAFGSMADQAYKFASTATKQFGLSELAAKNYSGTMMAMLNASGVAQESAAKMSTTLAGLAGDLASFYNIDTDTAFYKLRAGISGEIEPLKQLGINLSVKFLLRLHIVICVESFRERKSKRCVA